MCRRIFEAVGLKNVIGNIKKHKKKKTTKKEEENTTHYSFLTGINPVANYNTAFLLSTEQISVTIEFLTFYV